MTTQAPIDLLKSYPHRWGEGKVHLASGPFTTVCGIEPHAEPIQGGFEEVTCVRCLHAIHNV